MFLVARRKIDRGRWARSGGDADPPRAAPPGRQIGLGGAIHPSAIAGEGKPYVTRLCCVVRVRLREDCRG
ncbi:hypothetical protein [Oryza sativa Japonica Group]|uniref:OSJNBa0004B13.9 protein n=1 Tax=Oryza sativa subsp. japonica TaxID=39947 RepID=Q9ARY9_ORYSJ|nr:OSJNBa0004B13.9 [Oryza sativa Japonica Group]BAB64215.1 hypothetical protein [Oryza sativa Japonica Group]